MSFQSEHHVILCWLQECMMRFRFICSTDCNMPLSIAPGICHHLLSSFFSLSLFFFRLLQHLDWCHFCFMKTLTATGYVNIYWCFRWLPPCSQSSPTLVWVRSVLLLLCIPQINTLLVTQDMQLYIHKCITWTFPCYCFYYNPTTWAATPHLRRIYPHFWRVDAVMQGACHGWRSSAHNYTVNNNMVM